MANLCIDCIKEVGDVVVEKEKCSKCNGSKKSDMMLISKEGEKIFGMSSFGAKLNESFVN